MTMTDEPLFTADDIVSVYTRAQAIEDGVLVDVSAKANGIWKFPVALTSAAWEDFVAWSDADTLRKTWPQDEDGRLWDVLYMGAMAARKPTNNQADRRSFTFTRVPREGASRRPVEVEALIHCGPGDNGEPVITIMLPHED